MMADKGKFFSLKDETPAVQTSCKANHLYRDGNKYKTLRGQVIKSTFAPMKSNSKWGKHMKSALRLRRLDLYGDRCGLGWDREVLFSAGGRGYLSVI